MSVQAWLPPELRTAPSSSTFPPKSMFCWEWERREEVRITKLLAQFVKSKRDLAAVLNEPVRLVVGLERRLGSLLFKKFLALHFSQTPAPVEGVEDHPVIALVAQEIDADRQRGRTDPNVNPTNSAVFFLLGLYALLVTTNDWPTPSQPACRSTSIRSNRASGRQMAHHRQLPDRHCRFRARRAAIVSAESLAVAPCPS